MNNNETLTIVITSILIGVALFIALRELFTWYFKLNKIVQQNDEIIRLLKKIANEPVEIIDTNIKADSYQELLQKLSK